MIFFYALYFLIAIVTSVKTDHCETLRDHVVACSSSIKIMNDTHVIEKTKPDLVIVHNRSQKVMSNTLDFTWTEPYFTTWKTKHALATSCSIILTSPIHAKCIFTVYLIIELNDLGDVQFETTCESFTDNHRLGRPLISKSYISFRNVTTLEQKRQTLLPHEIHGLGLKEYK